MIYTATSKEFLTKTWANVEDTLREIKTPFPGEYQFRGHDCKSLRDVYTLHCSILDDLHTCIVVGKPKSGGGPRSSATFRDEATEFMYFDLDSLTMRESVPATIVHALPFLKGKAFVWYYSASSGFKAGVRVRVICHTPPMTLAQQRFAGEHYDRRLTALIGRKDPEKPPTRKPEYIDYSLYSKGHIIYSARPRLLDVTDPHPQRVFYVEGEEIADLKLPKTKVIKVTVASEKKPTLGGDWASEGNRDLSTFIFAENIIRYYGPQITDEKALGLWESEMDRHQVDTATRNEFTKIFKYKLKRARNDVTEDLTIDKVVLDNDIDWVSLKEAEAKLNKIVDRAVDLFNSVTLINVTPGVGKTTAILKGLANRYEGKNASPHDLSIWVKPTEYYLPTQEMCDQACEQASALGLKATVRRGRGREGMCFKHATDKKLHEFGEDAKDLLCKDDEHQCPEYDTCAYRQQFVDEQDAQIIFLPHSYLSLKRKIDFDKRRKPGLIVIDEAPWFGLVHLHEMKLKDLRDRDTSPELTERLCDAVENGITFEKLAAAGLTEEMFTTLRKAEKVRRPQLLLNPSMDDQQSLAAVNRFDSKWFEFDRVWKLMERAMKEGHLRNVRVENKTLYMHWRSEIDAIPRNADGDMECPVVILDATVRREVAEAFLPVDEYYEVHAEVSNDAKIEHVKEKASMASRIYGIRGIEGETDEEKIADAKQARERDERLAAGKTMITYKAWDEFSDNVHGHFGAIRGINKFEGQDLYIVGRTLPPPRMVERLAQAIFPRDIDWMAFGEWYPQRNVSTSKGSVQTDYHPDESVEAVRWMICEGEVEQAVHRARPVRHPVSITMVNNLPVRIRTSVERKLMQKVRDFKAYVPISGKERREYGRKADKILKPQENRYIKQGALLYAYRRPGARGPLSLALAMRAADIGEVEFIEVADHSYNDRTLFYREVQEMLQCYNSEEALELFDEWIVYQEDGREVFVLDRLDLLVGRHMLWGHAKHWPWHTGYDEFELERQARVTEEGLKERAG